MSVKFSRLDLFYWHDNVRLWPWNWTCRTPLTWQTTYPASTRNITLRIFSTATGSFASNGSITGLLLSPTIQANLQGENLATSKHKVRHVSGFAHIVVQPKINSSLTLIVDDARLADYRLKKLDLNISGNV